MGMYTEFIAAFELPSNTPTQVIEILTFMVDHTTEEPAELPNHPLFNEGSRWRFMLRADSYYFAGDTRSTIRKDTLFDRDESNAYYVTIRCNLKNYDDEIENFVDWIKAYIERDNEEVGELFIGYSRYETENKPTLIYV